MSTLWTGASGSKVALYELPTALSDNPNTIVCEQTEKRTLIRLRHDTFELVNGNELEVIRLDGWADPGWHRIWRAHGLSWWQRIFSNDVLGGWERVKDQDHLGKPPREQSYNAVLAMKDGKLQKIADEDKIKDLFDVPAEGLIYVGEPGIGILRTFDLSAVCR